MIQPNMFGKEPVLRNTSAVAMIFDIKMVRVLGNRSVRSAHCVVSIAVCMASMVLLLGIRHGRNHHTRQRAVDDESPARVSPWRATPLQNFECRLWCLANADGIGTSAVPSMYS
jgi:hypothetical protein